MISERIRTIAELKGKVHLLSEDDVMEALDWLKNIIISHSASDFSLATRRDLSDLDREEISRWLLTLIHEQVVSVYWPSEREGVSLSWSDFCDNFDELWLPGADDVWICSSGREWILDINHEEEAYFFKRVSQIPVVRKC